MLLAVSERESKAIIINHLAIICTASTVYISVTKLKQLFHQPPLNLFMMKYNTSLRSAVPLSTRRMTFLLSTQALLRLTALSALMEKDMGKAFTWLKIPRYCSVDAAAGDGAAGRVGLTFWWSLWTDIGNSSCSSGLMPAGAFGRPGEYRIFKKIALCEIKKKKTGLAVGFSPSMPCCSVAWVRVLCLVPHLSEHRTIKITTEARTSSVGTIITAWSYSLATGRNRNYEVLNWDDWTILAVGHVLALWIKHKSKHSNGV